MLFEGNSVTFGGWGTENEVGLKISWEYDCVFFLLVFSYSRVQFSSVAQSCPTLCDPMHHSTPGLPVHYQLPEFT